MIKTFISQNIYKISSSSIQENTYYGGNISFSDLINSGTSGDPINPTSNIRIPSSIDYYCLGDISVIDGDTYGSSDGFVRVAYTSEGDYSSRWASPMISETEDENDTSLSDALDHGILSTIKKLSAKISIYYDYDLDINSNGYHSKATYTLNGHTYELRVSNGSATLYADGTALGSDFSCAIAPDSDAMISGDIIYNPVTNNLEMTLSKNNVVQSTTPYNISLQDVTLYDLADSFASDYRIDEASNVELYMSSIAIFDI